MFLIDTNILIYHFNNSIPEKNRPQIREILNRNFNISVITKMEFLGFSGHTPESFTAAESFLEYARVLDISEDIVAAVIAMKRQYAVKLPDAIIAATAAHHDLTIVTRNEKDFEKTGIKIFNPFAD